MLSEVVTLEYLFMEEVSKLQDFSYIIVRAIYVPWLYRKEKGLLSVVLLASEYGEMK